MSDLNRTQMAPAPTVDPNRTVMGTAPTLNATQTIKPVQCPVCKKFNPVGVMFCVDCGLIFDRALPEDAFGAPTVQLPTLVDSTGREHTLRPGDQVIGRQGDLVVEDARLSRRHARLSLNGTDVTVTDLGSTNGTTLDGRALTPETAEALVPGQTLSLGGVEFSLSVPGAANKTAMPVANKTASISAPTVKTPVARLVGLDAPVDLFEGENTLGRRSENHVAIPDPYVSSRHGIITITGDSVTFTDVGSTNGTMIGGERLAPNEPFTLDEDTEVTIGNITFRVERIR